MTREQLIILLQGYKTLKRCFLGRKIHLMWNKGIDWCEKESKDDFKAKDPLAQIRFDLIRELVTGNTISEIESKMLAGIICKDIENKLMRLPHRQARIIFDYYINHDYEWKYGKFQGLPERTIAERLHTGKSNVRKSLENSLTLMLKMYNKNEGFQEHLYREKKIKKPEIESCLLA